MRPTELRISELRAASLAQEPIWVVHYACESFYAVKDRPVGISCISFVNFLSGGDETYSVTDRSQDGERHTLERYFKFLRDNAGARIVHWNMNSSDFGFRAIENRYAFLTGQEATAAHSADRLYDLDDLVSAQYGKDYADHPRLYNLGKLNGYRAQHLLLGKEEAEKFNKGEHGDIRRSTSDKARLIAFLLRRLLDGTLEAKGVGPYVGFAGSVLDSVRVAVAVGERFRDVQRQLARRHQQRPTLEVRDEHDAQDLYHALLKLFFTDVRKEEWVPSYAGSASRMDFLLPDYRLAVELKHSRPSLGRKSLGEELIVDAERYGQLPHVRHLVCLVFDSEGYIENPRGLEKDLSRLHGSLMVTVKIFDR